MRPYPGENFGILAQRWRTFRRPIIADVNNCIQITQAACVLHNYIQVSEQEISPRERRYCPTGFADYVDLDGRMHNGQWRDEPALRSVGRIGTNNAANRVKKYRDTLANYFVSGVGSVGWQYGYINRGAVP